MPAYDTIHEAVKNALIKEAICKSPYYICGAGSPDAETLFLYDEMNDFYMLFDIGSNGIERVRNIMVFIRIQNGKIWVEEDWTEEGITAEFLRAGVPNEDIVLGFQHPSMRQVADQFKVKFIVDTGDLTDFGSPAETALAGSIGKLPYPYVSVLGNHASQAVGAALAAQPNVTLLNGQLVTLNGVTLLGLPNPASQRDGVGSVDTSDAQIQAQRGKLLQTVRALPALPDIVAAHDPEESRALWGHVPLILCGHEHRYYIETRDASDAAPAPPNTPPVSAMKTILCNAGTTGAAGGRYLDKDKGVAFSCAVLTFKGRGQESGVRSQDIPSPISNTQHLLLRGIDMIVLNGELNQYSITHYTFNTGM